jgi:hypothetical protein
MGKIKVCPVCGKEVRLKLFPELSSSGLWCKHCGVNYGDPCETFPDLPRGLVSLIEGWNYLWDIGNTNHYIKGYYKDMLAYIGMELSLQLYAYYPNIFSSEWIESR